MLFKFEAGKPLKGLVLAAAPTLLDPNFYQTLVYLTEHGSEGALGVVMNRPIGKKLAQVSGDNELPDIIRNVPVFHGGPVKPTNLLFAHFQRGDTDDELRGRVIADPDDLTELPQIGWLRAFAGYAGWGAGQLERELRERAWVLCQPHTAMLDEPLPPTLWQAFLSEDQRWRKFHSLLPKPTSLD